MKQNKLATIFLITLAGLILAGCSSQDGAAQAVEGYLQALADKDQDTLVSLSCNAWEESALMELDSLVGVTAESQDLSCQESGTDGEDTLVTCTGKLVLNYNGELQDLDVSGRTMIARQEDGEWRACGYK
jgi:hypothetical protein